MKQISIQCRTFKFRGDDTVLFCPEAQCDYDLNVKSIAYVPMRRGVLPSNWQDRRVWRYVPQSRMKDVIVEGGVDGVYTPAAELDEKYKPFHMNIRTPDSMDESVEFALKKLKKAVGNVAEFVAERLHYSLPELAQCLGLEQMDAVALAIYNAEARNQGLIVGDQTGIGKGRVAASFIRYAILHGHKPIFFTEKPGLFSDIYRDLCAIHSSHYKPLIINADGSDILDEDGEPVYRYDKKLYKQAVSMGRVPDECDFVCCTYSQLNSEQSGDKGDFISMISRGNILVLDEAHNAGGAIEITTAKDGSAKISGKTGLMFQTKILPYCKGVMYLSATYAKFPKNMPIYAINTCISDLGDFLTKESVVEALNSNGNEKEGQVTAVENLQSVTRYFTSLPAQEIISSSMARYGQFIRREREVKNMEVRYITLDKEGAEQYEWPAANLRDKHFSIFENVTDIIAQIRSFQAHYFVPYLRKIYRSLAEQGERGKNPPSIASASVFSTLFSLMNNILLSLKAESIADRAIYHLQQGRKPVIAFAYTNEASLNAMIDDGTNIDSTAAGRIVKSDYAFIFEKVFRGLMYYYKSEGRQRIRYDVKIEDLGPEAEAEFNRIIERFRSTTTGLCMSPVDVIRDRIERAGRTMKDGSWRNFTVAECTGRENRLEFLNDNDYVVAKVGRVPKYSSKQGKHVTLCYNAFNNNEVDVLMINQSGSTGKSAHATNVGTKLKPEEVKQRVMIIGQAELDVNTEVQKRGRINRTGQFENLPPLYEYIYSAIPCEKRFMMMLKAKLKSLDANTTSNQNRSGGTVLECEDFFNKYGDEIVSKMLGDDRDLNNTLNDPLGVEVDAITKRKHIPVEEVARTSFGRMQVLPPKDQERLFNSVLTEYHILVDYLKSEDKFDLEMKELDLRARLISETLMNEGKNDSSRSDLSGPAFLGKYSVKSQIEYMKPKDVDMIVSQSQEAYKKVVEMFAENYKAMIVLRKERSKERMQKQIEEKKSKVARIESIIADYIDSELPQERIDAKKEDLKIERALLKELEKGKDPDLQFQLNSDKEKFDDLADMLNKIKPGSVYNYHGDICIVVRVDVGDASVADIFNRPSAIAIKVLSTSGVNMIGNKSQYLPVINMAEAGMALLTEITEKKAYMRDYEKFVDDDSRRDEMMIVTGNIVPLVGPGIVVTRFTMEDGTFQNGIIVKPVLNSETGMLEMPEWAQMATISLDDKSIQAVLKSLSSDNARVNFIGSGHGDFYVKAMRRNGYIECMLYAGPGYKQFLFETLPPSVFQNQIDRMSFKEGLFSGWISDVRDLLAELRKNNFRARVHYANLDNYTDTMVEKYKAAEWPKLSYDKSKIPADSTYVAPVKSPKKTSSGNSVSDLLLAELGLLSKKVATKPKGDYQIVDYSAKAWAITGDTSALKDKIKALNGKYNKYLRGGAGWVISKKYSREQIANKLAA